MAAQGCDAMDEKSYAQNYDFENYYWWFVGRRIIVETMIKKYLRNVKEAVALDSGCGTGITLINLAHYARPIGIDSSATALDYAKKRDIINILRADICAAPFKSESFDLITMLGVLYNAGVKNDDEAIAEAFRILKRGGIIVLDEAAYDFLKTRHNLNVGGVRRYTRRKIITKLEKCGFRVLKSTYWNLLMFFLFFMIAVLEKSNIIKKELSGLNKLPDCLNSILIKYLQLEALFLRRRNIPFGPSVLLVGLKP